MFNFGKKTIVNKEYKLSDYLKRLNASKEVRTDANKIKSIKISNVLKKETLNCLDDETYKYIVIFEIELKSKEIPMLFIKEVDKNSFLHTYFICRYEDKTASLIAYKDIANKISVDKYYYHDFEDDKYLELPFFNSIADIYKYLLSYVINMPSRISESPSEYIERVNNINKLSNKIKILSIKIEREVQPRKQFEHNEERRQYIKELEELKKVEE